MGKKTIAVPLTCADNYNLDAVDLSEYEFTRPGYRQIGWMTASGQTTPSVDTIWKPTGNGTLYAIWESVGPEFVTTENVISATVPNKWCSTNQVAQVFLATYDANGKMLLCTSGEYISGVDLILELETVGAATCRLFFLDENMVPVAECMPTSLDQN